MIELTVGDKTLKFNLKNREREKSLYDAWYALSDIPKYRYKKFKITTDKNKILIYEVCEITKCIFTDKEYSESEKETTVARLDKIYEATNDKYLPDNVDIEILSVEEIYDRYFPSISDFAKELRKTICTLFQGIPKKKLRNVLEFVTRIRKLGYYFDTMDQGASQIVMEMTVGPDDTNVAIYVDKFVQYMKRKNINKE